MSTNELPRIDVPSLFSVKGKVAVVTGGSRGIGLMIAQGFVEAGAKVYISSRKKDVCDQVAAQLSAIGTCISFPADLSKEEECVRLAKEIGEREPEVHVLINNAGAMWGEDIATYPASAFNKILGLNVVSPFILTRELLPQLRKASRPGDPARVINVGSIDGIQTPMFETFAYSSSKAAIHQLTRHLASQLAPAITVNAIAPGPFESKMTEFMLGNFKEAIVGNCPMGRIGEAADMAGVAIYLASRAASYVTGVVIPVDGGIIIKG